jgi:hypothetical protein
MTPTPQGSNPHTAQRTSIGTLGKSLWSICRSHRANDQAQEVLIWGRLPNRIDLGGYTLVAVAVAWAGWSWFQKIRKVFADVL